MVASYLVHHSYCATAEAFAKSTDQAVHEELASIKNRQSECSYISISISYSPFFKVDTVVVFVDLKIIKEPKWLVWFLSARHSQPAYVDF